MFGFTRTKYRIQIFDQSACGRWEFMQTFMWFLLIFFVHDHALSRFFLLPHNLSGLRRIVDVVVTFACLN